MNEITEITKKILAFRDARDWKQFHNLKDLSAGLAIEASELQEVFLWKSAQEGDPQKIKEELADILSYALLIANEAGLDPIEIIEDKLKVNAQKYPVEKAKGKNTKYTEL
jgi:NTP pyrophosphatase (non-canonical NTP hydrolase)